MFRELPGRHQHRTNGSQHLLWRLLRSPHFSPSEGLRSKITSSSSSKSGDRRNLTENAIYQLYSLPLLTSSVSLLNRLYEILYQPHRPVYLLGRRLSTQSSPGGVYRAYKKLSTIYRLAAVLGWIRACRREFSYLRFAELEVGGGVHKAIDDFENALADGSWVEWERASRLCELWLLCKPGDLMKVPGANGLGIQIDNLISDHLENAQVEDVSLFDEQARRLLSKQVADCLSSHLKTNLVQADSFERTLPDAFAILGMREAWIYRDWQSAVGDMMIRPAESDDRKYEIIGYGEFEQLDSSSTGKERLAIDRLFQVFDDLDLSIEDRFDARPTQLRAVAKASAELILAIDRIQGQRSILSAYSRARAEEVLVKGKEQSSADRISGGQKFVETPLPRHRYW